jgi:hypothetical protein
LASDAEDLETMMCALFGLAAVAIERRSAERSVTFLGVATGIRDRNGFSLDPHPARVSDLTLQSIRKRLPDHSVEEALAAGDEIAMGDVMEWFAEVRQA